MGSHSWKSHNLKEEDCKTELCIMVLSSQSMGQPAGRFRVRGEYTGRRVTDLVSKYLRTLSLLVQW